MSESEASKKLCRLSKTQIIFCLTQYFPSIPSSPLSSHFLHPLSVIEHCTLILDDRASEMRLVLIRKKIALSLFVLFIDPDTLSLSLSNTNNNEEWSALAISINEACKLPIEWCSHVHYVDGLIYTQGHEGVNFVMVGKLIHFCRVFIF